jgi:hypothetical protein
MESKDSFIMGSLSGWNADPKTFYVHYWINKNEKRKYIGLI